MPRKSIPKLYNGSESPKKSYIDFEAEMLKVSEAETEITI
jgi:hypothetical protein